MQRRVGIRNGSLEKTKFIMTIDTTKAGSASDTFILRCGNIGTYNATIEWGDGSTSTITTFNDTDLTHVYSVGGVYQIKISGSLPWIYYQNSGDVKKLISINQWGILPFTSFDRSFSGCSNLDILATDVPDFSVIKAMGGAFSNCTSLTNFPFAGADFSNVIEWNQSGLSAFYNCTSLTSIDMTGMLMNTTNSYTFTNQFQSCTNLTSVIGFNTLNFSKCTNIGDTFRSSGLTSIDMSGMDFSSCTSFIRLFFSCTNLDYGDFTDITLNSIGNINIQQVFNGLGTSNLIGLDTWNIEKVNIFNSFMNGTTITTTEYDKILIAWDSQDVVNGLYVNFGSSKYTLGSAAATARAGLIANDLWTITDGGGI
jgi:hypothetical protein